MRLFIFAALLFFPQIAFAYIDPGTAGIVLQAILGGFVAVMAFLSIWSKKIMDFLRSLFGIKHSKNQPKNKK